MLMISREKETLRGSVKKIEIQHNRTKYEGDLVDIPEYSFTGWGWASCEFEDLTKQSLIEEHITCKEFDEKGNLLKIIKGKLETREYIYSLGKLIEEHSYLMNNIKMTTKAIYNYDDAGNLTEINQYNYYQFDDFSSEMIYSEKGRLVNPIILKHDDNGNAVVVKRGDTVDSHVYDLIGNLIEKISKSSPPSVFDYHKFYTYNNKRLVQERWGETESIGFEEVDWNEQFLTKQTNYNRHKTKYTISYQYDEYRNVIQIKKEKDEINMNNGENTNIKLIFDFKYEYDKQQNWTKRTRYVNGILDYTSNRKIEYFY